MDLEHVVLFDLDWFLLLLLCLIKFNTVLEERKSVGHSSGPKSVFGSLHVLAFMSRSGKEIYLRGTDSSLHLFTRLFFFCFSFLYGCLSQTF